MNQFNIFVLYNNITNILIVTYLLHCYGNYHFIQNITWTWCHSVGTCIIDI